MPDLSFAGWVIIAAALAFDYVNGFHDAANSIATVVSTRVLSPRLAVAWAAFWNFAAFLVFGTAVAKTIGSGTIDLGGIATREEGLNLVLGALIGAITYDLITWYFGLPTSSSHALVGGLVGAALVYGGTDMLVTSGIWKIAIFIVISPLLGLILAVVLMNVVLYVTQKLTSSERVSLGGANLWFRRTQLISAAAYSLGHGANDAQKTMGIIAAVVLIDQALPVSDYRVDFWMVIAAHAAIAAGTMSGGWRIVHTLGSKITKLQPVGGFSAETAAAVTLFATANLGIPVSTTHTITGAIIGVGATNRLTAIRWGLTGKVLYAWVLTIPGAAVIAAASYEMLRVIPADIVVPVGFIAAASWVVLHFRRRRIEDREAVFAPPA
jgi:inorganic phosphate transporter, PiT family